MRDLTSDLAVLTLGETLCISQSRMQSPQTQ